MTAPMWLLLVAVCYCGLGSLVACALGRTAREADRDAAAMAPGPEPKRKAA